MSGIGICLQCLWLSVIRNALLMPITSLHPQPLVKHPLHAQ